MNKTLKIRALPPLCAALTIAGAFAAGFVTANLSYTTTVNEGLVKALNSVGQNTFGSAAFSAQRLWPTEPCDDASCLAGVQLDLSAGMGFPVYSNVFWPQDPCRVIAQLRVGGGADPVLLVEETSTLDVEFTDLSSIRTGLPQCAVSPPHIH